MITRRNLMVALRPPARLRRRRARIVGLDWNAIPAKETKVGSVRSFCKAPTATLEELELHVTTLNPGQSRTHRTATQRGTGDPARGHRRSAGERRLEAAGPRLRHLQRVEPTPRLRNVGTVPRSTTHQLTTAATPKPSA